MANKQEAYQGHAADSVAKLTADNPDMVAPADRPDFDRRAYEREQAEKAAAEQEG